LRVRLLLYGRFWGWNHLFLGEPVLVAALTLPACTRRALPGERFRHPRAASSSGVISRGSGDCTEPVGSSRPAQLAAPMFPSPSAATTVALRNDRLRLAYKIIHSIEDLMFLSSDHIRCRLRIRKRPFLQRVQVVSFVP
jgi:hypothetical protein